MENIQREKMSILSWSSFILIIKKMHFFLYHIGMETYVELFGSSETSV